MAFRNSLVVGASLLLLACAVSRAEVKTVVEHNEGDRASPKFKFKTVPSPSKTDAATKARFSIVFGERDPNGGDVDKLHDGRLPSEQDEPAENFFFNAGTEGGRLLLDLGGVSDVKQVNTYSWHPDTRGPQVYKLYAADGRAEGFNARPGKGTDPVKAGWKRVASVDTRPKAGEGGGQYGVSVSDSDGALGKYRYLLFDVSRTEDADPFGNTFYSEIDVIGTGPDAAAAGAAAPTTGPTTRRAVAAGKYEITIDTANAPELAEWVDAKLMPVCVKWYPIIVDMLPSEGFEAPKSFTITFRSNMNVPAATGGTRIMCWTDWMKKNVNGEAAGAVVHEMVHVVQQYRRAPRGNQANQAPRPNTGWLTEGIPDYIRWFKYEPETHGADIRNPARARYDASYRVSANFLNWVTQKYDKDIVRKINAALREGKYTEDLWKQYTGKTVQELGEGWKAGVGKKD